MTGLQERIAALAAIDGQPFRADTWQRPEGGGGVSRVIEERSVIRARRRQFLARQGQRLPPSAAAARPELAGRAWDALGVSLVLHPRNPYVPTMHMNVRYFSARTGAAAPVWWFGGGFDLTPYYGYEDDVMHWHGACRDVLAPFGADVYPRTKDGATSIFTSSTATKRAASAGCSSTT